MLVLNIAGCTVMPAQGPQSWDVPAESAGSLEGAPYVTLDLTPTVVSILARHGEIRKAPGIFDRRGAPTFRVGVGDLLAISIFEAAAGGLFIPGEAGSRAGNFVNLPSQEVDRSGNISVPYAGQVPAAGRTLFDIQRTIEERLRNRAIEPQAVVTLQEARSSLVSVTGEVNQSVRFSLTRPGEKLLDALARAGGPKWPPYESYISVSRDGREQKAYFNQLLSDPRNNIFLRPGDTIVVSREQRSFMALGASGANGMISFEAETLTMAEAVGRAGGILDFRGDPAQTFIYRLEPPETLRDLGRPEVAAGRGFVPVIYRVNMRDPQGFFLASQFQMRDKDILYVSNAASVEFTKVLQLIRLTANTIEDSDASRTILKGYRR